MVVDLRLLDSVPAQPIRQAQQKHQYGLHRRGSAVRHKAKRSQSLRAPVSMGCGFDESSKPINRRQRDLATSCRTGILLSVRTAKLAPQLDEPRKAQPACHLQIAEFRGADEEPFAGGLYRLFGEGTPSVPEHALGLHPRRRRSHERVHRQRASSRTSVAFGKARFLLRPHRLPCARSGRPTLLRPMQETRADSSPVLQSRFVSDHHIHALMVRLFGRDFEVCDLFRGRNWVFMNRRQHFAWSEILHVFSSELAFERKSHTSKSLPL